MDRRPMDRGSLEHDLRLLGRELDYPAPVDLVPSVVARLRTEPRVTVPFRRRARWQPVAAAFFVLVLVGALSLTAVPGFRQAVADLLGFEKLIIEVDDAPAPELGRRLDLGRRVGIQEARRSFGSPVPVHGRLGAPDAVYLSNDAVPMMSVVYGPAPGLPPAATNGVSVLVSALDATLFQGFGEKVVQSSQATVQVADVRGLPGYWIQGEHAFFVYSTDEGVDHVETARIADNVLIWQEGSIIYRVEGDLTRRAAVAFANGLELDD